MTRKRLFVYALSLLWAVPLSGVAQNYQFDHLLRNGQEYNGGIHGLAVDADDNVWVQPWSDTGTYIDADGNSHDTRPIYVFDVNGEHTSFSPINALEYGDGEVDIFTQNSRNRGLARDHNGDILASLGTVLYRIDHKTGEVITRRDFELEALAAVSSTDNGETAISFAAHNTPVLIVDENFDQIKFLAYEEGLSRSIEISGDGKYVLQFDPYARTTWLHYSENGVNGDYGMPQQILEGMFIESSYIHPVTGHLWISSGSRNNAATEGWFYPAWYGIDIEAIVHNGTSTRDAIVQEILWHEDDGQSDLRPRGVAFSNNGHKAYFGMYRTSAVQVFTDDSFLTEVEDNSQVIEGFSLQQNYPNPFNPSTSIGFSLEEAGMTTLIIYNTLGQKVAMPVDEFMAAGSHSVNFEAANLTSGIYLYVLESGNMRISRHMTLVK